MNKAPQSDSSSDASKAASNPVGMRITSDPDDTIVEQPATFGARETSAAPFRTLLVSDLNPQREAPVDWATGTHVRQVDPNSFATQMREMAPALTLEVPNTLSDTPAQWTLDLRFPALDAFRPEEVAQQAEPLQSLQRVSELVAAVAEGTADLDAFQSQLDALDIDPEWARDLYQTLTLDEAAEDSASRASSPRESTRPAEDGSLDRLLGMVDTDEPEASSAAPDPSTAPSRQEPSRQEKEGDSSRLVSALMSAMVGNGAHASVDASAAEQLQRDLQAALHDQLHPVVHHPAFRRLEAAWRGLKFLVDRLNFRENVQLAVLPAGRDDLHEAMHHQVLLPEHSRERDEPPVSLILVDQAFGREHLDIEQLSDLAGTGQSLQVPVVASADPSFFGMAKLSGLRKLPALRPHLQGDAYAEWNALRRQNEAQFLGVALPSVLLRAPYRANGKTGRLDEDEGLMGGGALAVGVAAARSFVETGWPTHLDAAVLEDLPVQAVRGGQSPLAALLPGSTQSELARAGFIVLGARPNDDTVRVVHASMVKQPATYDDPEAAAEARAHASLPCQLFVARAAHALLALEADLPPGGSIEEARQAVAEAMASFLGVPTPDLPPAAGDSEEPTDGDSNEAEEDTAEEGAEAADPPPPIAVEHVPDVDLPDHELLAVRLRPPKEVLHPAVQLVMGVQVPRPADA